MECGIVWNDKQNKVKVLWPILQIVKLVFIYKYKTINLYGGMVDAYDLKSYPAG